MPDEIAKPPGTYRGVVKSPGVSGVCVYTGFGSRRPVAWVGRKGESLRGSVWARRFGCRCSVAVVTP